MRGFEKVAIANRGEVAVRIIRACQELGIKTVLLHSEADINSLAFRISDETACIGPASVNESYLNIEANIDYAKACGADAIHPGFGFLSENAEFAQKVEDSRMVFIGPSSRTIDLFGNKISAKNLVLKAGAPVIPGYQGENQSIDILVSESEKIGYPVICKAAAGGGGRGLRILRNSQEAAELIGAAKREGLSAFGSDTVFLEKYLEKAKHIEIQIFGDHDGKVYHLCERECSVQRRHQKIIEESLSPALDETLRRKICTAAVEIAIQAKYRGAGTVEFLVENGEFYFLEMNTRLQVEHPVTEMVMGVDLVKAQILSAQKQSVLWDQKDLRPTGHSIECRIYAEDSYSKGIPSVGVLGQMIWPHGAGRRFEVGFETGDEITAHYDPMFAKVIVWDENRFRAIQKMKQTLRETVIFGVKTNIAFLLKILDHPDFIEGTMNTRFIDDYFSYGLEEMALTESELLLREELYSSIGSTSAKINSGVGQEIPSPWAHHWEGSR